MSPHQQENKVPEDDPLKCHCGKWAKPTRLKIEGLDIRGWACSCGEQYLHPEDSPRLSALKKIQSSKLEATVTKTGNSIALRIPKAAADALALKVGEKLLLNFKRPKKLVFSAR